MQILRSVFVNKWSSLEFALRTKMQNTYAQLLYERVRRRDGQTENCPPGEY